MSEALGQYPGNGEGDMSDRENSPLEGFGCRDLVDWGKSRSFDELASSLSLCRRSRPEKAPLPVVSRRRLSVGMAGSRARGRSAVGAGALGSALWIFEIASLLRIRGLVNSASTLLC